MANRRPEPPQPDPEEQRAVGWMALQAFATAGRVHLLAQRMRDLSWGMDDYSHDDLERLAQALRRTAITAASHSGDPQILGQATGRG